MLKQVSKVPFFLGGIVNIVRGRVFSGGARVGRVAPDLQSTSPRVIGRCEPEDLESNDSHHVARSRPGCPKEKSPLQKILEWTRSKMFAQEEAEEEHTLPKVEDIIHYRPEL